MNQLIFTCLSVTILYCAYQVRGHAINTSTTKAAGNETKILQESGICSWYGAEGEIPPGWPTACDEPFDRFAMKAAHKTLPCGTRIRVRNLDNGKTVDVTINDRGPFTPGRILDLTYGAFGQVENHDRGLFQCDYQLI